MADVPSEDPPKRNAPLARTLKALRRLRRMRPADVAEQMGLPLRSYEHFEGGHGRLNVERIRTFAEVTDTDSEAILAGLVIGSPEFAVRCADNKLMTILTMALQDFDAAAGDGLARLPPRALIAAFESVFRDLAEQSRRSDGFVESWMSSRARATAERGPSEE